MDQDSNRKLKPDYEAFGDLDASFDDFNPRHVFSRAFIGFLRTCRETAAIALVTVVAVGMAVSCWRGTSDWALTTSVAMLLAFGVFAIYYEGTRGKKEESASRQTEPGSQSAGARKTRTAKRGNGPDTVRGDPAVSGRL